MKSTKKILSIDKLHAFENHPYKVQDNEEMEALAESIKEHGIVSPVIVRPLENTTDEYEIISGHRRVMASRKAGITEVPALIVSLDRDAAAIVLVDSNLHREHILPSEKAFAYKMKMDAMKHQGTSRQLGTKLRSDEEIAETAGESARQIQRYIRLTNLIPEILQMVDEGKIALTPAVELSYLDKDTQEIVLDAMEQEDCTPSYSQAVRMKKLYNSNLLDEDTIYSIMAEEKANQREKISFHVNDIRDYFPRGYTASQMSREILQALEERRVRAIRERDRDDR